jgi:signal transduction histidine kinase
MASLERCTGELANEGFADTQAALVEQLRVELPARLSAGDDRNALVRGDAESALQERLEELGIADAWELAPPIVAAGWSVKDFDTLTAGYSPSQQAALSRWLASAVVAYSLLETLSQGANRIAEIVAAVKSYVYLDQAAVQLLDIHEGLESTLVILRHKLKQGVQVVREYDRSVPRIEAYGGELNQVWTIILDNAIDAMQGQGVLRIRTYSVQDARGAGAVVVEISDTGPGIPAGIQDRIFDAFFTTKEPGQGSGLGLHIAYGIVVNQHRGEIGVESRPGETTFRVSLPVHM